MRYAPLAEATDIACYGSKAVRLGAALRAGLPVPDGVAVSAELLAAVADGEPAGLGHLDALLAAAGGAAAVRSSAMGEDSVSASFAGLYITEVNVTTLAALHEALQRVHRSASTPAVLVYQQRMGIKGPSRMAAVVQKMLPSQCAGVLFTHDPLSGAETYLVEAAWGLGECVVSGRITPDSYRLDLQGRVSERRAGCKDVMLRNRSGGGTEEVEVPPSSRDVFCLTDAQLAQLYELARRCQAAFGAKLDLEWAFANGELFLLQCRPITR